MYKVSWSYNGDDGKQMRSNDSPAVLAVTKGNLFSDQLTDRALKITRNSQSILTVDGLPIRTERTGSGNKKRDVSQNGKI